VPANLPTRRRTLWSRGWRGCSPARAGPRRALWHDGALGRFAQAVTDAWERTVSAEQLVAATRSAAEKVDDPGLGLAVLYIGAVVLHRLPRHPVAMVEAAGAVGPNVHHVVAEMMRFGKQAFWPSRSAAIQGGLLGRGHPSMAIKMLTSAGKTTLVELVCADAVDADVEGVAVVLGPTKALVRQLSSDLRKALPDTVSVASSHGGLDFGIEGPSAEGLPTVTGVVVVTLERFDLEWRQYVSSSDDSVIGRIRVLVVDEAHRRRSASDHRDGTRVWSRVHLGPCHPRWDPGGVALEPIADGR
jgi:hypothetical protein